MLAAFGERGAIGAGDCLMNIHITLPCQFVIEYLNALKQVMCNYRLHRITYTLRSVHPVGNPIRLSSKSGEGIDCLVRHPGYTRVYCPDK